MEGAAAAGAPCQGRRSRADPGGRSSCAESRCSALPWSVTTRSGCTTSKQTPSKSRATSWSSSTRTLTPFTWLRVRNPSARRKSLLPNGPVPPSWTGPASPKRRCTWATVSGSGRRRTATRTTTGSASSESSAGPMVGDGGKAAVRGGKGSGGDRWANDRSRRGLFLDVLVAIARAAERRSIRRCSARRDHDIDEEKIVVGCLELDAVRSRREIQMAVIAAELVDDANEPPVDVDPRTPRLHIELQS